MEGPEDRCPYQRPFADGFDCCAAYQPVRYVPLDLTHAPMRPVWTCGHLVTAASAEGGYYGSCRLGGPGDREAWVRGFAADRLARWQEIAREFGVALAAPMAEMFAAKARHVKHLGTPGPELDSAVADLKATTDRFLAMDFELLDRRADELARIGFPTGPMRTVTSLAMANLLTRESLDGGFDPPEDIMASFPDETRDFLAGLFRGSSLGDAPA